MKQVKDERGLSNQQLGRMAGGVSRQTVDGWLRGKPLKGARFPHLEHLAALAQAIGRPLDWFVTDGEPSFDLGRALCQAIESRSPGTPLVGPRAQVAVLEATLTAWARAINVTGMLRAKRVGLEMGLEPRGKEILDLMLRGAEHKGVPVEFVQAIPFPDLGF